jgi:hypothetical protein
MPRPFWASIAAIALSHAAYATSLSLSTDKPTYLVGETITVTVNGDDGTDEAGFSPQSYAVYGRLDYNGALVDSGSRSQLRLQGEVNPWVLCGCGLGAADTNGAGSYSEAFYQVSGQSAQSALNLPGTLSTVTLIASAVGIVDLNWHASFDGTGLDFFGITNLYSIEAPGTSFTIVPEPGTAALFAFGLLGLAVRRRTRTKLPSVCTACVVIAIAHQVSAASLSISTDKPTYLVGETVTVTVFGDDGFFDSGDPAVTYSVFGRLDYSGALVDNGTRTQTPLVGHAPGYGSGTWVQVPLAANDDGNVATSDAFSQLVNPAGPQTADNLPGLLSSVTLIATAVGTVNVNWHVVNDGYALDFFGLTNAPGTSFMIVPEPAPGVLLALGLLGLGFSRAAGRAGRGSSRRPRTHRRSPPTR